MSDWRSFLVMQVCGVTLGVVLVLIGGVVVQEFHIGMVWASVIGGTTAIVGYLIGASLYLNQRFR